MRKFTFGISLLISCALSAQESTDSFERKNLGEGINTKYNEFTPRISGDGKTLFFVREGHPKNKNKSDIWYAELGPNGHWQEAVRLDDKINKVDANCVWSVNADGKTLLLRGAFDKGNYLRRGFSTTRLTSEGWTDPQMLVIENIETMDHGDNDGAYLSTDGNVLVFTFCEKLNCHANNLYISTKKEDGSFTRPTKILDSISTSFNEFAPFLASDNKTLYFSSDRPGGLGHSDIYKSERLDSTWLHWSLPVNLGPRINTTEKDGYYMTDAKGEYGYLVSELNTFGGTDIIRVKLTKEQTHNPVVLMDGKVYDAKTKKLVTHCTVEYNVYPEDADEGIAHPDHKTGQYKMILPYGENYEVNVYAKGYVPYYDTISLKSDVMEYKEVKRDFYLTPVEVGQSVELKHVYFEPGKYDLLLESHYELDKVVRLMKENKALEIEVGGHSDDIGKDEENLELSQKRATTIMNYIVAKGVELYRVTAIGYGETKPKVANDTDANRKINRRVEFTIKKR
jgi:outer membrane protein OmpA-like peptidoglycan-associated protein